MISTEDLPLLELFKQLRKAGFPLGIEEYQMLLRALQAGFGISDDADELQSNSAQADLDALKRLCQTLWVKSLEDIPVFNYHFKQYMQPRRKETLAQTEDTQTQTEHEAFSSPTSETLPLQTPQPTPTPATTSELATAMPDDVEASRALALLQTASTVDETSYNPIIQTDEYLPVTRRQMKQSWRHLRRPTRQGPPTELDIEATVNDIGRQGILFEPILVSRRINRAALLLLIDQGGSMTPFHPLSRRLTETAVRGGRFGSVNIYYFHNCPLEYLYHDPAQVKAELVKDVLDRLHHEQTGVLIFSDAGAARHKYNSELDEVLLREFVEYGFPVIPVLLPDAPQKPQLPVFLRGRQWVDFRKKEPDPITQLIWGITGKEPEATDEDELVRNPVFSNGYAVLIGVGADLPITVKDASALHDLLVNPSQAAYPRYQVQLLTETLATRQSILDAFDRLIAQVNNNPDATVIIYFSGHAMHIRDIGKPEKYFLIPYGYEPNRLIETAISDTEFTNKITEIKARKLAVFLDCGLTSGAASLKEPEQRSIEISSVSSDLLMMTRTRGKGIVVASCQQNELSYVGTQYSIFTECLIEALEGKAKTEARKDDFIYIIDVVAYLLEQVPQRTSDRQHPVVNQISNLSDNFPLCYYAGGSKDIPAKAPLPLRGYAAKAELVDKLLAYSCMSNRGTRETVLSLLNEQFPGIVNSISRHTNNKSDVMEIVSTCLKYPGSLQELIGIITYFEGESALPAQDLRAFLLSNSF